MDRDRLMHETAINVAKERVETKSALNTELDVYDLHRMFVMGVEWADDNPANKWISVRGALPGYKNKCIVRVEFRGKMEEVKSNITIGWLVSENKWNVEITGVKVTHWMEIPEFTE